METTTRDFHHPYEPYDIQLEMMDAIYDCIAQGKVGIFESPTGTGKSLSLICSSLTWLRAAQEDALKDFGGIGVDEDEPSWVGEHAQKERRSAVLEQRSQVEARLRQIRAKELQQKQHYEKGEPKSKRMKPDETEKTSKREDDAQFELEEYNSDDECIQVKAPSHLPVDRGLSAASLQLMQKVGLAPNASAQTEELLPVDELKVFYCSRTHSQLAQFIQEVRRVDFPPSSWMMEYDVGLPNKPEGKSIVKHVPLGSRKNLCINSKVSKLGSPPAINERCLELQQPDTPKDQKCPFVPNKENATLVNDFRDHALAKVRDIEDLGSLGRKLGICPYYASRAAIKPSEIVTLPYPLLLQKSAREALDISLKGHVVIIDEAHNLMDTISNIYSVSITQAQLKRCRAQLGVYLQRYRNKLKGKNRIYVAQTIRLLDSVSGYLDRIALKDTAMDGIVDISSLMAGNGVDQINLYKLMHYLQESRLARKVDGYVRHAERQSSKIEPKADPNFHASTMPVLTLVQSFFQTLTNPAPEGRFFYEKDNNKDLALRYMLLDPTHHFKEIVEDARAVILAGGTMSPMDDYVRHLFTYVNPAQIQTFSCGHVIPEDNLIALPVIRGPGGVEFDFTYNKRNSLAIIEALGDCLIQLSGCIPDGLVVFFPSYAYLDQVVRFWQCENPRTGLKPLWNRLMQRKPVFRECQASTGTDDILSQYSQAIAAGSGGLLLSVIGGKMSEGINFSDALGRGVVVVGLPYPNIQSAQWKAKLQYVEKSAIERGGSLGEGKALARDFYENACMRAVNQSIGRAIRHRGDFACIMLLDGRYKTPRIEGKLPGWIKQGIPKRSGPSDFQGVIAKVNLFFESKKAS